MPLHLQAQRVTTWQLQCAVGRETYPLRHYPVTYTCPQCAGACLPRCGAHDAPLHLVAAAAAAATTRGETRWALQALLVVLLVALLTGGATMTALARLAP